MKKFLLYGSCLLILAATTLYAGNGDLVVNGNLGIGVTEPGVKLDIEGGAYLGYETLITNFGSVLKSGFYQGNNVVGAPPDSSLPWHHLITARHNNGANNYQLQISSSYTQNDRLFFRKIAVDPAAVSNPGWNEFATRSSNLFTGNQRFPGSGIWNTSGKVGIGTTAPSYPLEVVGTIYSSNPSGGFKFPDGSMQTTAFLGSAQTITASNVLSGSFGTGNYSFPSSLSVGSTTAPTSGVAYFNGNVGIGTTSPGDKLDVQGGKIKWASSFLTTDQGGSIELGNTGTPFIDFKNDATSDHDMRIRLTGDDSLAIEGGTLSIFSTAVPLILSESDKTGATGYWRLPTDNGMLRIDQNTASARDFSTYRTPFTIDSSGNVRLGGLAQASGGTETMFIGVNNGNVGIGTTTPGTYKLYVSGEAYTTQYWSGSDSKFKKNMKNIENALTQVQKLKGVSYEWKKEDYPDHGFSDGRHYGVIAQEIEKVLPEVVKVNADGSKAVAYMEIIPVLIEAIKAQQEQIEELKKNLSELKQK